MAATANGPEKPPTLAIKDTDKPTGSGKPERPDEEHYRNDLAAAEKELTTANENLVCGLNYLYSNIIGFFFYILYTRAIPLSWRS